jgi:hypothetical protein
LVDFKRFLVTSKIAVGEGQHGDIIPLVEGAKIVTLTPKVPRVLMRSSILRKIAIKYNLEEYFGIDIQMKVIDLEFLIPSMRLDSPMLS